MISRLALLAVLVLPLPALAQGDPGGTPAGGAVGPTAGAVRVPPPAGAPSGALPVVQANRAAMARMHESMMAVPETGDPDRDFAAGMVPHHEGAIAMAEVELRYGHDPRMRALARSIIASQRQEVALMRSWLAAHPARPAGVSAPATARGH